MRVMLTTQISGSRDGRDWPPPGTVVDLPDSEAQGLLDGGGAVEAAGADSPKVLVSPAGVHVPGITSHGVATTGLVEVPSDALSDPQGTRDALVDVAEGNLKEVPAGVGTAASDGTALTVEQVDKNVKREEATREALDVVAPKVGDDGPMTKANTPVVKKTDTK
jgi:hypothetical protein